MNALAAVRRVAGFVRHLPPRRIGRRLSLALKRYLLVHLHRSTTAPPPSDLILQIDGFEPLFDPEPGRIETSPHGFVFSFLGRSVAMECIVDWSVQVDPPVGQLWRMNLHYTEYLGDVADVDFVLLVDQWIVANRPYGRGYWRESWNAYALSTRTTVWMEQLVRRRSRLPPEFVDRLCSSLEEQLAFLAHNLETDIGGNHLIKNLRALVTGARLFAGPRAQQWLGTALEILESELDIQVLADGVHFERSPSYHCQVLADLLAIRHAMADRKADEAPIIRIVDDALTRMAQPVADLAHPDGLVALLNDFGLHMAIAPDALLAGYARVFGRRPFPRNHFAFPAAGYYGFRSEEIYVVADCGRLGPDALMAHAHGDALSFELSIAGKRIVVDQGVFEYAAGERRTLARSVRSHNTLAIEGLDQAAFFGSFRCGARADVAVTDYVETPDGFRLAGWHDGFARTGDGPIHRRRFELDGGRLTIHDELDRAAAAQVAITILLHPSCHVQRVGEIALVTRGSAQLRIEASVPITVEPAVYWPDMGVEEPTQRLRLPWPPGSLEATIQLTADARSNAPGAMAAENHGGRDAPRAVGR